MAKHTIYLLRALYTLGAVILIALAPVQAEEPGSLPADATSLVNQAFQLFEAGKATSALEVFNQALAHDPADLSARLGQAMVFQELQRHKDAFAAYDLIVQKHPDHAFAWNGRGLAAFNQGDFDHALSSFQRATTDQPVNGFFYESLAWTHFCRGEHEAAARAAKQATLMYHHNGENAAYPLLIAYFSQLEAGFADEARRTLQYALKNKPANNAWPSPIFDYLTGNLSRVDLISHVTNTAEETEAHTYIGLRLRSGGADKEAEPHFDWVALKGNKQVFEYTLARTLHSQNKDSKVAQLAH